MDKSLLLTPTSGKDITHPFARPAQQHTLKQLATIARLRRIAFKTQAQTPKRVNSDGQVLADPSPTKTKGRVDFRGEMLFPSENAEFSH
jgi:hypothetical protein